MRSFRWLHLSDLHQGQPGQRWLWPQFEHLFSEDIAALHARSGPWDLVIFTGDLTFSGTASEFGAFEGTMQGIFDRVKVLGSSPYFLAIPGNHDLMRPESEVYQATALPRWRSDRRLQNDFWKSTAHPCREIMTEAFRTYADWWANTSLPKPPDLRPGPLPGDLSVTIRADDLTLGVAGLNTAFLQLAGGNFRGKLAIGPAQFHEACEGNGARWAAERDACLLLSHHPPDWLSSEARRTFNGEIAPPGRFAVHLFGHMHENALRALSPGSAEPWRLWQGASLFGLELYGERRTWKRSHGYSAGAIDFPDDSGPATLRIWPRIAHMQPNGVWKILPDNLNTDLTPEESTIPVALQRRGAPPVPTAARAAHRRKVAGSEGGRLSVLLASTDRDLLEARKQVAQYLTLSLDANVVHYNPSSPTDPSKFDCVVLLQGWWWDSGAAAQAWLQADRTTRLAFVADEGSEWPPRSLAEVLADSEVKKFRTLLESPVVFQHPGQLAEKVGKAVSRLLENAAPGGGMAHKNLHDWERTYLEYRLPAWKAGRTTAGRTHLLDAEQATELYRPEFYVPLDGESDRWVADSNGMPVPFKPTTKDFLERHPQRRRVRLSRWLTLGETPRLALVAAPGGGKTIFLTRMAAHLACFGVGKPVDLEVLDLKGSGARDGVRVPIVIEATRIAEHDSSGWQGLVRALVQEIAQALGNPPLESDIDLGLRQGRYVLLVDALDEVADAERRQRTLALLKAAAGRSPEVRIVITTRSAKYTGSLAFGPEFEVVNVSPLSMEQVESFCAKWTTHRRQNYLADLQSAVAWLSETASDNVEERTLTANPLMLTAICMVYERHRALPDDRSELCSLLVDDLCRSRRSEDQVREWFLGESEKRDLLERIALAMQEEGQQAWALSKAEAVALQGLPEDSIDRTTRATRHVQWIAEHTGLIRFEQTEVGAEEVRFWHRLFREYLAAHGLARRDATVEMLLGDLWRSGRLADPFWEDVVRLLPRSLGTREKAQELVRGLQRLAEQERDGRGRLLGLIAAAVVESRALFPGVNTKALAAQMAATYEAEGPDWPFADRLLLLRGLGRLDPGTGDPRLLAERWIATNSLRGKAKVSLSWAPTTVQEYQAFVLLPERASSEYWEPTPEKDRLTILDASQREWKAQLRSPNSPVTGVSLDEALAYCRWRTSIRTDGRIVTLPMPSEWLEGLRDPDTGKRSDDFEITEEGLPVERGVKWPVGTQRPSKRGLVDLAGAIWQWCLPERPAQLGSRKGKRRPAKPSAPVMGGLVRHRTKGGTRRVREGYEALAEPWVRAPILGFRCALLEPRD